jgi:hypothetical protein
MLTCCSGKASRLGSPCLGSPISRSAPSTAKPIRDVSANLPLTRQFSRSGDRRSQRAR